MRAGGFLYFLKAPRRGLQTTPIFVLAYIHGRLSAKVMVALRLAGCEAGYSRVNK